jgi:hypothetical protein
MPRRMLSAVALEFSLLPAFGLKADLQGHASMLTIHLVGGHRMDRSRLQTVIALLAVCLLTAVIWRVGSSWIALQRVRLVTSLTEGLRSNDEDRAVAAIDSLSRLNEAGVESLVAEAMNTRPRVAPAARWAVDDMLARWRQDSLRDPHQQRLALRLERLSAALVGQLADKSVEPLLWARQLAENMLRLAAEIPAGARLGIVDHCSSVLHFTSALAHVTPIDREPVPQSGSEVGPIGALPDGSVAGSTGDESASPSSDMPHQSALPYRNRKALSEAGAASEIAPAERIGSVRARFSDPRNETRAQTDHGAVIWQPDRMTGGTARTANLPHMIDTPGRSAPDEAPGGPLQSDASPPHRVQTTEVQLLTRLAHASTEDVDRAQQELAQRGWGKVRPELANMLISESPADRLRALDTLRNTTGVNPRPALMMLTADPDPNVRRAVVTLLATSRDPELLEQAWQTAIRDEDPRVAELADWLQSNRRR